MLLLVKPATLGDTTLWVFFTFFKFCKLYQITQSIKFFVLLTMQCSVVMLLQRHHQLKSKGDKFTHTAQKVRFSIKDFFSQCDQIHSFIRIWSQLLKKSLIENFTFCAFEILK